MSEQEPRDKEAPWYLGCWWCGKQAGQGVGPLVCNDQETLAMCGGCAEKIAQFLKPGERSLTGASPREQAFLDADAKKTNAEKLTWLRSFVEYARYELQPGEAIVGSQFPHQADADRALRLLNELSTGASAQCSHNFEDLAIAIKWCKKCGCVQTDEGDTFYVENRCP